MAEWFEPLRPLCKEACLAAGSTHPTELVLFYLARCCQKEAKRSEPDVAAVDHDVAARIARNLAEDGARVERLIAGDATEWAALERLLIGTARRRAGEAARDYADEALQRIAIVLLTGTPPSRAAESLRGGPEGPANEYVFQSPFQYWAQTIVINLFIDERRRAAREREGPAPAAPAKPSQPIDGARLRESHAALPGLLDAIRKLPAKQRSAMALSLACADIDEMARDRLRRLAPDFFSDDSPAIGASDQEIAEHLGTIPHRVAANRSVARRKLAARDARWELLLDALLPHASTRPIAAVAASTTESDD